MMYAIAMVFLLAGMATLVIGFFEGGLLLVFVSIGASAAAALFLVAGVLRKRSLRPATAGAPYGPEEGAREAAVGTAERTAAPPPREETKPAPPRPPRRPAAPEPAAGAPPEAPSERTPSKEPAAKKAPSKKPAAKKAPAKKAPSKKPAAKKAPSKKAAAKAASPRSRVVSLPERGTYHQADCRFVKGRRDTETITLATAKKRDYSACGVCKPG